MAYDGQVVSAIKEFIYTTDVVERGEVFRLRGNRNDGYLIKHKLVQEQPRKISDNPPHQCDDCSKGFIDELTLHIHYRGRIHPASPNYDGDKSRHTLERPSPQVVSPLVGVGTTPRYQL